MKCLQKFKKIYRSEKKFEIIEGELVYHATLKSKYYLPEDFDAVAARKELNNKMAAYIYTKTNGKPQDCTLFIRVEPELSYDIHYISGKKLWCARARLGVYSPNGKKIINSEFLNNEPV